MKKAELLSKSELLEIFVNHRVDSVFPGDWESIFKGSGYEFWDLREMVTSDTCGSIDWKATAKTGKPWIREYLAESYVNLMILYDVSRSMTAGDKELSAANIAASLAYTAARANNGCGMILFADNVKTYIPPRMGWFHFGKIIRTIAEASPIRCGKTDPNPALGKLMAELPESLTFILSDFLYPVKLNFTFKDRMYGNKRHEVKALQILEDFEIALPAKSKGMILLHDYETGEKKLIDLSKWKIYNRKRGEFIEKVHSRLNAAGIDTVILKPSDDFAAKIKTLMDSRN